MSVCDLCDECTPIAHCVECNLDLCEEENCLEDYHVNKPGHTFTPLESGVDAHEPKVKREAMLVTPMDSLDISLLTGRASPMPPEAAVDAVESEIGGVMEIGLHSARKHTPASEGGSTHGNNDGDADVLTANREEEVDFDALSQPLEITCQVF
jgi:hypothetical protein